MERSQEPYAQFKKRFFTDLSVAVETILERRKDERIAKKVNVFLNNDTPKHFIKSKPVLYLSRHIATPNFECNRFIELSKPYNLPIVIGQDKKGKFVSVNSTKKCLGKMSAVAGINKHNDEILENFTLINFKESDGKPLGEITTIFNENLLEFHNSLVKAIYGDTVEIAEEGDWLDNHNRNNLQKEYEHMLSLNIYHSILFESFPDDEEPFFHDIFEVAYNNVSNYFGFNPLVVETISDELESTRDWDSYPQSVHSLLTKKFSTLM